MASTVSQDRVGVLQQSINDVLLQTGQALKAAQAQGPRNLEGVRTRLSAGMTASIETYQHAVDDIEREILDAKATFWRDLRAVRARIEASKQAKQKAEQQSGQQAGQQATAIKPDQSQSPVPKAVPPPPTQASASPVAQGLKGAQQLQQSQVQTPPVLHNGAQQGPSSRPVAPVPDMGVDLPQPQARTSPIALKKGRGAGTPTPVHKPSPRMNGAGKTGAGASPANNGTMPASVTTPKPQPTASTVAPAASMSAAPVPLMDATQAKELSNFPPTTSSAALNFTDMEFTLAQGNDTGNRRPSQPMSIDMPSGNVEVIDLDSMFDTPPATGAHQSAAPTASMSLGDTPKAMDQAQQPMTMHDDMYDLGGGTAESMDLDFALDQSGGDSSSYMKDLFFGTGDGSLGELDDSGLV